jgi:hypothetical protein
MMTPQDLASADLFSVQNILTAAFAAISALFGYLMKAQRDRIKDKDRAATHAELRAEKAAKDLDDCERVRKILMQENEIIRSRR